MKGGFDGKSADAVVPDSSPGEGGRLRGAAVPNCEMLSNSKPTPRQLCGVTNWVKHCFLGERVITCAFLCNPNGEAKQNLA